MTAMRIPPSFFIVGAPKCGTSSLWQWLQSHEQVSMADIKEPLFFTRVTGYLDGGSVRAPTGSGSFERGWQWYGSLFSNCQRVTGEASTAYFHCGDSADMLAEYAPQAKIIICLRDPVERMQSHHGHELRLLHDLCGSFNDAVRSGDPRVEFYVHVSRYRQHLDRFYATFPAKQIHIVLMDDIRDRPHDVWNDVCEFLEIDQDAAVPSFDVVNARQGRRWPALQRLVARNGLGHDPRIPRWIRRIGRRVRGLIVQINTTDAPDVSIDPQVHAALLARCASDIVYVEALLDRDLSKWRKGP